MTRIYGASDDLIEVEGDVIGEHGCYDEDTILRCDDGTVLTVHYGKFTPDSPSTEEGIWAITVQVRGILFDRLEVCNNEDDDIYSDQALFHDGLKQVEAGVWDGAGDDINRERAWVEVS
jgi:hypothetical protein